MLYTRRHGDMEIYILSGQQMKPAVKSRTRSIIVNGVVLSISPKMGK